MRLKFWDNNAVILNSSGPYLILKKKHHYINYSYIWEAVASAMELIYKVDTGLNIADLFTKLLDKLNKKEIIQHIIY